MYLQLSISSPIPSGLPPNVLLWLHDILSRASNIYDLFGAISGFFEYCTQYNLNIHPTTCVPHTRIDRWRDHILSEEGICFDPKPINEVRNMHERTVGKRTVFLYFLRQIGRANVRSRRA